MKGTDYEGVVLKSCPVCRGEIFTPIYEIQGDRSITVVLCEYCALGFQLNPLMRSELSKYYQSHSIFYQHGEGSRQQTLIAARHKFLESHLHYVNGLQKEGGGVALDVGCGYGDFLASLDNKVWKRHGLELNPERAAYARKTYGLMVDEQSLEDSRILNGSIDLFCAFAVLEHLMNPTQFLENARRVLKSNGIGCLSVPDILHPLIAVSDFFSVEHVLYFSPNTLQTTLESSGFTISKIGSITLDYPDIACIFRHVNDTRLEHLHNGISSRADEVRRIKTVICQYTNERTKLIESIRQRLTDANVFSRLDSVAVFGAGEHTKQLLFVLPELRRVVVFFDSDPRKCGSRFFDGVVYPLNRINELSIDRIIISSRAFEDEIATSLSNTLPGHVKVIRLYS